MPHSCRSEDPGPLCELIAAIGERASPSANYAIGWNCYKLGSRTESELVDKNLATWLVRRETGCSNTPVGSLITQPTELAGPNCAHCVGSALASGRLRPHTKARDTHMDDFRELTDDEMTQWWTAYKQAHKACVGEVEAVRRAYAAIGIKKNW